MYYNLLTLCSKNLFYKKRYISRILLWFCWNIDFKVKWCFLKETTTKILPKCWLHNRKVIFCLRNLFYKKRYISRILLWFCWNIDFKVKRCFLKETTTKILPKCWLHNRKVIFCLRKLLGNNILTSLFGNAFRKHF